MGSNTGTVKSVHTSAGYGSYLRLRDLRQMVDEANELEIGDDVYIQLTDDSMVGNLKVVEYKWDKP